MTTEQIHDSREAFEKWHLENYGFTPSSQNQVNDSIPVDRWIVWQACEAQHQQLKQSMQAWIDHHCDRADNAEERVKRLVDALENIMAQGVEPSNEHANIRLGKCYHIAKTALDEKP